jgi:hypothetical protein
MTEYSVINPLGDIIMELSEIIYTLALGYAGYHIVLNLVGQALFCAADAVLKANEKK